MFLQFRLTSHFSFVQGFCMQTITSKKQVSDTQVQTYTTKYHVQYSSMYNVLHKTLSMFY